MTLAMTTIKRLAVLLLLIPVTGLAAEPGIDTVAPFGSGQFSNLGAGMVIVIFAILVLGFLYAKT